MATGHSNLKENEQQQIVERRIGRLWSHLGKLQSEEEQQHGLGMEECAGGKKGVKFTVSSVVLADFLKGEHRALQERMILYFKDHPELQTPVEICKEQHRELVLKQLEAIVKEVGIRPLRCVVEDPAQYFAIGEAAGLVDLSLGIKLGVQYSLWGGSVMNLGTQKHRDKYYEKIENLDYLGCFAMTELHHGSNVQGLQTTATFDLKTDEFIINTPNEGAAKWWIGNAAVHGKFATVFCRLILPDNEHEEGVDMGVHAFIVPIRDMETHKPLPGVEIRDCGYKIGLNGVDNGALKFNSVRIPRDNLLNRFGDVSKDGQYTSSLPTINKRFAATVGELTGGRVALAKGSVGVLQAVVTIAVRFSLLRQQFGPPKQSEISILDYQSQQHKLMPMLATAYAFHFAGTYLVDKYSEMKKTRDEVLTADVHALSAGLKAYITSYTAKATSICRESCGGHGYAAANRFGSLRNDHDIFQTFEGDNTVLLQQVAADLLKRYKEKFQGGTLNATWIYLSDAMTTYLSEANPVVARREGQDHLRDPKFHLDAFRYRTSRLLHTVALRLQKHTKTLGGFQAWNRCLNHLLTVAESHVESIILERFIEAVNSCKDRNSRAVLKLLCDLYALDRIWKDIGTYRNVDYVAPNKAKAIHRLTERLSFDVRSVARELVDAFGFPDFMLRAPIGMQSGQYTEYTTSNVGF